MPAHSLVTPSVDAIAQVLRERDHLDAETSDWAGSICGGHVGRARRLARDEDARSRRKRAMALAGAALRPGTAYAAAEELVQSAELEARELTAERDEAGDRGDADRARRGRHRPRAPPEPCGARPACSRNSNVVRSLAPPGPGATPSIARSWISRSVPRRIGLPFGSSPLQIIPTWRNRRRTSRVARRERACCGASRRSGLPGGTRSERQTQVRRRRTRRPPGRRVQVERARFAFGPGGRDRLACAERHAALAQS